METLEQLVVEAKKAFALRFGGAPRWVVAAPGRVNLIGEHTDYNDGFVFPMAIERYTVLAADRAPEGSPVDLAEVYSVEMDRSATIRVATPIEPGPVEWSSYVQGTVAGCVTAGLKPEAFRAVVRSNVPLGGGLSSSAALEVATATLVEAMTGHTLDKTQKVLLCQKAEHEYAKMPCGIMDQFASVMAEKDHLLWLDCRAQRAEMVPLADPGVSVLIANSNVKHELTGGEYAERRARCYNAAEILGVPFLRDATMEKLLAAKNLLDEVAFRRARHVIGENDRTRATADALKRGSWDEVGLLMYASHYSLRDDYEVSCEELDLLVSLAEAIGSTGGMIGSRMTGGGFGGCTVSLVQTDRVAEVAQQLRDGYMKRTGIEPTIFSTRPAKGAMVVEG